MPSDRPITVSAESAASTRWPIAVTKKLASGVPWCGVFIVVTLRSRGNHASTVGGIELVAGEATSRASSPPVE